MFDKGFVIATKNYKKADELIRILGELGITAQTLKDYPECPDIIEDGNTFEANAIKKAVVSSYYTGKHAIADDSGLEVYSLGNLPGVNSARFAGNNADDTSNNQKLLNSLSNFTGDDRRARFVCVIALVTDNGLIKTFKSSVEGKIAFDLSGTKGFGYDPLFIPEGYQETFGELPPDVKDKISHRGKALILLKDYLEDNLKNRTKL